MSSGFTDEFGNELIPDIALPNELPPLPNLADLPPQVLHSGTVETLLGQNEDLFARLKVTFKTNAELERQLMIKEQSELEIKHINSSLLAQIQVLQEKDKAQKLKQDELESKVASLNAAVETENYRNTNSQLQLQEKGEAFESLRNKLNEAAHHIESQEEALRELEAQLSSDFELRLAKAVAQHQLLQSEANAQHLLAQSEANQKLQSAAAEAQKLQAELADIKEKSGKLQNISEKCADAENRLVYFERRSEELESRYNKEFSELQSQLTIYRTEAKTLSLQLHNTEQRLDEKLAECVRLKESLTESQDQFESLQTLWAEGQKRLEENRLKYDSLHKINQELSRKLKDQRAVSADPTLYSETPLEGDVQSKAQKFERLENLLAGIQAGFPTSSAGMIEDNKSPKGQAEI